MSKTIISLLLSCAIHTFAYAQSSFALPSHIQTTPQGVLYTVSKNETLSEIAFSLTGHIKHWQAIGKLNHIHNERVIPVGKKVLIPAQLLKLHSVTAEIKNTFGNVLIQGQDDSNIAATPGALLKEGDRLRTQKNGFITLGLDDGTQITLMPNSDIQLKLLRSTEYVATPRTQLLLQKGRVESHVTPFARPESKYEVISPFAVSGVRGTHFRVHLDDNKVLNEVLEGKVAVESRRSATQLLAGGFGSVVQKNGRVGKLTALPSIPTLHDGYQEQQRLPIQFILSHPAAHAFHVTISTDAEGRNMIAEANASSSNNQAIAKLDDLADGDYFVRYSALNAAGLEGVTAIEPFRVNARPFPPFLLKPDAKFQSNGTEDRTAVDMQWTQASNAATYRLQVASDAAFHTIVAEQTTDVNSTQAVVNLQPGHYYWRVASIADNGKKQGPFGDARKLEVLPGRTAPVVETNSDNVHFSWSANAGQKFTFQVADTPTFSTLLHEIETTQAEASIPHPHAGTYYARIRSTDADGFVGIFSVPQQFAIKLHWQTGYDLPLRSKGQTVGTDF